MFHIIQSNDVYQLFNDLLRQYQQKNNAVFESFIVIVPSKVMGEWLKKQVAEQAGISTLITTEFWGRYQWQLIEQVSNTLAYFYPEQTLQVPKVAVLSRSVMQWRLFSYLTHAQSQILTNENHVLYPFLTQLLNNHAYQSAELPLSFVIKNQQQVQLNTNEQRLWQFANDIASMFSRYITYRPDWLQMWAEDKALPIEDMITAKDIMINRIEGRFDDDCIFSPDWLVADYIQLEQAQRFLWRLLFVDVYQYRQKLENQFWRALTHQDNKVRQACQNTLPKKLVLFTVQQLPQIELTMMQRLAQFIDIILLHYNPSALFWADIVDKNWLLQRRFINPQSVYLKDYGHTLLSRFGKQSREVFAMLADLSGNDDNQVIWEDKFIENDNPTTLLAQLQQDILMLSEQDTEKKVEEIIQEIYQNPRSPDRQRLWQINQLDNSLSIHACHSMVRQLEVLRSMLIGWLNYTDTPYYPNHIQEIPKDHQRSLSDILVLLPNIEEQQAVIESIFPKGIGTDGYSLPAKVTGVVSKEINQLWSAIKGFFTLLNQTGSRFEKTQVFDWLMLPPLFESYGLTHEQMARGCELLGQAGFVRGFDEHHLQQTLHESDDDYRFSFVYALERLVAGLLMPNVVMTNFGEYYNSQGNLEKILPFANVQLADTQIIATLVDIYQQLNQCRLLNKQQHTAEDWLKKIEEFIHKKFSVFEQTNALKSIWRAQNLFKNNIRANQRYQKFHDNSRYQMNNKLNSENIQLENLKLKLSFILNSIETEIHQQQISAEPTGDITFGRIGAIRNLPYKLVVMMNLNLTNFPSKDPNNRYNLMQAEISRKGDKFKEDDELGAFLDAILCAKETCWLFYNGASTSDTHQHLPASPIQELINFLQGEIKWQTKQLNINKQQKVLEWLVTHHPSLPFSQNYFNHLKNAKLYPPAKIWHAVYQQLQQKNKQTQKQQFIIWNKQQMTQWLAEWEKQQQIVHAETQGVHYTTLNKIIQNMQNPAQRFLQNQKIHQPNIKQIVSNENLEMIDLDTLTRYKIHHFLLSNEFNLLQNNYLAYSSLLPAGVNRQYSLINQQQIIINNLKNFLVKSHKLQQKLSINHLQNIPDNQQLIIQQAKNMITSCHEQQIMIKIPVLEEETINIQQLWQDFNITVNLPDSKQQHQNQWINYLPTSGKEKYQLQFWLHHLCWQVHRQTSLQQVKQSDGYSLWQYNHEKTFYLAPIEWQQAYQYLQDWVLCWSLSGQTVLILPPETTISYLKKPENTLSTWYNQHVEYLSEDNLQHPNWQLLLKHQANKKAIFPFLETFGKLLYQPLIDHLKDLTME